MPKLKIKPQNTKLKVLEEISNQTDEGIENAVLIALSDGKSYTEKEIKDRVEKIIIVAGIEILRREGIFQVSKNFNWLTNWSVKAKRMKCPQCKTVWKLSKNRERYCPICGLDLIASAEKMFPKLKKGKEIKEKSAE